MASIKIVPGYIYVNGQPFHIDGIRPIFNVDRTTVKIVHPYYDDFRNCMDETAITDIENVNTGGNYANISELESSIQDGFYSTTV